MGERSIATRGEDEEMGSNRSRQESSPSLATSRFMPYQETQVSCQRSENDQRRLVAIRKNHDKENTLP